VSASVNLPLHHKFSSGTSSPRWSQKKGRETVVVWCGKRECVCLFVTFIPDTPVEQVQQKSLTSCQLLHFPQTTVTTKKLSGEVLAWLSVCGEVQMICI